MKKIIPLFLIASGLLTAQALSIKELKWAKDTFGSMQFSPIETGVLVTADLSEVPAGKDLHCFTVCYMPSETDFSKYKGISFTVSFKEPVFSGIGIIITERKTGAKHYSGDLPLGTIPGDTTLVVPFSKLELPPWGRGKKAAGDNSFDAADIVDIRIGSTFKERVSGKFLIKNITLLTDIPSENKSAPEAPPQGKASIKLLVPALKTAAYAVERPGGVLPFNLPDTTTLRASAKKVFAHYHIFAKNMGGSTRPIESDYYSAGWLHINGENNKHKTQGGYLRDRPLSVPPNPSMNDEDFAKLCAETDITDGINAGLDGFIINFTSASTNDNWWKGTYRGVWEASKRIAPWFSMMLMPDCTIGFKDGDVNKFLELLNRVKDEPNVFRHDEKIVLAPYYGEKYSPEKWKEMLAKFNENGTPVFFIPCVQGFSRLAPTYAGTAHGLAEWSAICDTVGNATNESARTATKLVHDAGYSIWMQPVRPQDFRPHAGTVNEAGNTTLLRESWMRAIEGGADWVQIVTWSDHYESSAIRPTVGAQYLFSDLSAYYSAWFKAGKPPAITRDALMYCHRLHSSKAAPDTTLQTKGLPIKFRGGNPVDEIEMLAFLTAPATLTIVIGDKTYTQNADAGLSSFTVPLAEGRPVFSIARGGRDIVRTRSRYTISDRIIFSDFMYFGGSSLREPELAVANPERFISGAVLELSCNEVWGPILYDSSGFGNHAVAYVMTNDGEVTTITHTYGREGNGIYQLPRVRLEKQLRISLTPQLAPETFTVCAWIKPAGETNGSIISSLDGTLGFAFGFTEPGKLGITTGGKTLSSRIVVKTNAWTHVAAVCGTSSRAIYVNGVKLASDTGASFEKRTDGTMFIAKDYYGGLDEIVMYPRALTENEIKAMAK
ncbi:MAG: hypothetical protein HZC28_09585 [Spirochaetes bacterium]|nr:hypothetical protein [Spirochaetota bacterium]